MGDSTTSTPVTLSDGSPAAPRSNNALHHPIVVEDSAKLKESDDWTLWSIAFLARLDQYDARMRSMLEGDAEADTWPQQQRKALDRILANWIIIGCTQPVIQHISLYAGSGVEAREALEARFNPSRGEARLSIYDRWQNLALRSGSKEDVDEFIREFKSVTLQMRKDDEAQAEGERPFGVHPLRQARAHPPHHLLALRRPA